MDTSNEKVQNLMCKLKWLDRQGLCAKCKHLHSCPDKKSGSYLMETNNCKFYEPMFNFEEDKVNNMEMWKENIKEECKRMKEYYEKLNAYNNKREVEQHLGEWEEPKTLEEKRKARAEYHRTELGKRQQEIMREYIHILELRLLFEEIDL